MLLSITSVVNFLGLAAALWLGLYVVTRSPRRLISWLTGLALWCLTGPFLSILLALTPLPRPAGAPGWLSPFLQFWEANVRQGASSWLQGWSVVPAIAFWHHATVLMRPRVLNRWRWTRILFGYGVAVAAIAVQANTSLLISSTLAVDPLYLSTSRTGPLYPLFLALGLLLTGMSLVNLVRSANVAPTNIPRKQFLTLAAATLSAGLALPISSAGWLSGLRVPTVVGSLLLGLAVVLIGYGVAQYSALVDGRTIRRDFYYNAIAIGVVTGLYLFVTWISVQLFRVPGVTFIFVVLLAIVTHSLVDVARRYLDPLLYRRDVRQVRDNLHRLVSIAGEQGVLDEHLSITLDSLCASVRAIFGLIFLFDGKDAVRLAATYRWHQGAPQLSPQDLTADDVLHLEPGQFSPPLTEAALLIPLYADAEQLGALVLGRPVNGVSYLQADVDLLLYPSDRLADAIRDARRKAEYVAQVTQVIETSKPQTVEYPDQISIKAVEDALRHMVDYAYLGDHPLTRFRLVRSRVAADDAVTHLDLGKAAYDVLAEAVEKLRPDDAPPGDPPPREWYPYLILYSAYLEDVPNRDIMSRLYISEGTFNRTRRTALRAITRALEEMESALH